MPIELYWDVEDPQILIFEPQNPISWAQYREAIDNVAKVLESTSAMVYILGLSQTDMPRGNGMYHLMRTQNLLRPFDNFQLWVSVIPHEFVVARMLLRTTAQAFPGQANKFQMVETEMAGRLLIRKAQMLALNGES